MNRQMSRQIYRQTAGQARNNSQAVRRAEPASGPDRDPEREQEEMRQKRRRERRAMRRARREQEVRRQKVLTAVLLAAVILVLAGGCSLLRRALVRSRLSDAVLGYQSTVEYYAEQEGIGKYVDVLLAIMMVETEGKGQDVMQSSESKGLETNSLGPEESIEQACVYFAALTQIEEGLGIDDDSALIQAYNFGPGYLTYVAEHGGKHTQKLAIAYAKENSGGEKVRYLHLYAIRKNGGWIYQFGNMFYADLVEKYL